MEMFKVGDKILRLNDDTIYTITEADYTSGALPYYVAESDKDSIMGYGTNWRKVVTADDALRYGEVLTDDKFFGNSIRIRTIRYESHIFYHKMVNGEVVEFKELN